MTEPDTDFGEAIDLPAGCWVHSKTGDLMLPGGSVVGKLSESGLRALELYLDDLARLSPPSEPRQEIAAVRRTEREACAKIAGMPDARGDTSRAIRETSRLVKKLDIGI